MKIKNKFTAGALLTLASLAIVGSITSSFAWYSYNTKDPISYHGIASGNSENLQVKITGTSEWKQSLTTSDLVSKSQTDGYAGQNLTPVSFKTTHSEISQIQDADFFGRPETYTNKMTAGVGIKGSDGKYGWMETKFDIRCIDPAKSTLEAPSFIEQDIYISDLRIVAKAAGKDITSAVRIYLSTGTESHLIAPGVLQTPDAAKVTTNLYGNLKADGLTVDKGISEGNGVYRPAYEYETGAVDILYGTNGVTETALCNGSASVATFENGKYKEGGFKIGRTNSSAEVPLTVTMMIYLQGWADAVKDSNAAAEFDLGMTLECNSIEYVAPQES